MRRAALLLLLSPAFFAGSGCYYAQAVCGQLGILCGRVPLERAIARADLPNAEREQLTLVPEVLAFAGERLALTPGGSYRTFYDTGTGPVSWNVTGCKKTSFEAHTWTFPFVGEVPYKGYFKREGAEEEAACLRELGLDARVSEVPAYSTLGWFDDPVFRSMLRYGRYDFVNTLIHEITHATVYREDDADFNESLATFVGEAGATAFLEDRFGARSSEVQEAEQRSHDAKLFQAFMADLYERLERLYTSDRTEAEKLTLREQEFAIAKARFEAYRRERFVTNGYRGFAGLALDNCYLLSYRTYNRDLSSFAEVHRLSGGFWAKTLDVFREAAASDDAFAHLAAWCDRATKRDK